MTDAISVFLLTISALFPIVDPLSGSPIFLQLTSDLSSPMRRSLSRRVALDSFFLMVGSYFVGSYVLSFFGVSLPVVQVAGGMVVVSIGWKMLLQKDEERNTGKGAVEPQKVFRQAFYPLTLPLTVGPGSISVAITLGAHMSRHYGLHIAVIAAALIGTGLVAASVYVCYGFADRLTKILGETATTVIIRLASFLLLCIGVQIVWNGIKALLMSLQLHV